MNCPNQPSDDSLTVKHSLIHPAVFINLYDHYAPGVYRYAFLRVGGDLADEVVVRSFLKAFRQRRLFSSRSISFQAWIYGIASRVISSYPHAEAKRFRTMSQELGTTALYSLGSRERDAFLLMTWGRLPLSEAAQALGMSTERLERRLDRTLQRITNRIPGSVR
ncbi:RNA polymerase sigma factor [Streptomyces sp. CA-251387]|uniref:RNA polymerase sigma factor n=1 Tax=Streptomyces sp. CA-251387 TaxID=3240064 RepID=UPI003D8AA91D